MLYIILRGGGEILLFRNVHTPCEDKSDDIVDSFYEELGFVLDA
jgi:hypothetical protein